MATAVWLDEMRYGRPTDRPTKSENEREEGREAAAAFKPAVRIGGGSSAVASCEFLLLRQGRFIRPFFVHSLLHYLYLCSLAITPALAPHRIHFARDRPSVYVYLRTDLPAVYGSKRAV